MGSFKTGGLDLGLSVAQTACEVLSFLGSQAQELGDAGAAACKAKRAVINGKGTRKSAKVSADKQYDILYQQFRDEQRYHHAARHLAGTPLEDDSAVTRQMLSNAKVNLCDLEDLEEDYDDDIPEEPKKSKKSKSKAPKVETEDEPEDEEFEDDEPEDEDDEETAPPPTRKKKAPPVESTRPKKVKGTRKIRKARIAEDEFDAKYRYN